ncbi:hypothetical protein HH310_01560 [Actinoplanes sp. TBRC 11911]|uniref:hypothetical protein n=1 Tax=Actinoplanes sp. TBRC 11911 TaxID=2729386 RepID=UPI00145FD072|nr:hypothetical protein [Actinoplanes sp. TBRC 11911]NMO49888.1 hypothetical protein [Actinoplanes sp. TBRC 11911]
MSGAGPAVGVGALGWLLAHAVTFWLSAHSNPGAPERATTAIRVLAAVCVLAVALAAVRRTPSRRYEWAASGVVGSVGLSTLVFFAADAVEHSALGQRPTPPALLLLGALMHILFSVGSSLMWLRFSSTVLVLLGWLCPAGEASSGRRIRASQRTRRPRRLLWAAAVAGRAPPGLA